jgi:hypothetical protein
MFPKILRIRLDAIERFSLARAVLVAMEMCLAFARHPGESRDLIVVPGLAGIHSGPARLAKRGRSPMRNAEDAKSRESRFLGPQLQRLENPCRSML